MEWGNPGVFIGLHIYSVRRSAEGTHSWLNETKNFTSQCAPWTSTRKTNLQADPCVSVCGQHQFRDSHRNFKTRLFLKKRKSWSWESPVSVAFATSLLFHPPVELTSLGGFHQRVRIQSKRSRFSPTPIGTHHHWKPGSCRSRKFSSPGLSSVFSS